MSELKKLTDYEIMTLKPILKRIGYKLRTKSYSEFKSILVVHIASNTVINDANVFSPEFLAEHSEAFKIINQYKTMIVRY